MTTDFSFIGIDGEEALKPNNYQVSSQIIAVLATFQDPKKKEEYIKALGYLSGADQEDLKKRLVDAKSDVERWQILTDIVKQIQESSKYKNSQPELDSDKRLKQKNMLFAAGALLIGGVFVYIIVKKI